RDYAEDDLASLYKGPLLYCRDAFEGLHVMDAISSGHTQRIVSEQKQRTEKRKRLRETAVKPQSTDAANVEPIAKDNPVPVPPFWGRRVVKDIPAKQVFSYINENALFLGQWGLKKGALSQEDYDKLIDEKARPIFEDLQKRAVEEKFIEPKVVYGYF